MSASPETSKPAAPQEGLLRLLQIEREARRAENLNALRFTCVNAPRQLLEYQQAILWDPVTGVQALSGLSTVERDAPFVRWVERFLREHPPTRGARERASLPAAEQDAWRQWLPEQLWLEPLMAAPGLPGAASLTMPWLILARTQPWAVPEQTLLGELGEALGHAWSLFAKKRTWRGPKRSLLGLAVVAGILMIPVRQTVVAPVEVIPVDPVLIRVSLDGVIDRIHVQPNQRVQVGQPLLDLDPTALNGRLDVARNALSVAEADYRQVAQQALLDPRAKALVALRRGDVDRRQAELRYLEQLSERLRIQSPVEGIAVLSDPNDWLGRAVRVGEKVMDVADPNRVELLIRLPVEDMLPLPDKAAVDAYLNIAPDDAVPARVHFLSYQAEPTPEGTLAYRIKAELLDTTTAPRVGLRGTARIYGDRVSFGYWLFRRPWSWLRQWIGGW